MSRSERSDEATKLRDSALDVVVTWRGWAGAGDPDGTRDLGRMIERLADQIDQEGER